jgi:hypothetical protein
MDAIEANALLTHASQIDPRSKTQVERAEEWADRLHDVSLEAGMEALRLHQRESDVPVMPVHILANVKRIVADRSRRQSKELEAVYEKPWHPAPSRDLLDRMSAAHDDPVLLAALRTEYHDELRDAGFDPDQGSRGVPPSTTPFFRGQGRDFAIPVGDR